MMRRLGPMVFTAVVVALVSVALSSHAGAFEAMARTDLAVVTGAHADDYCSGLVWCHATTKCSWDGQDMRCEYEDGEKYRHCTGTDGQGCDDDDRWLCYVVKWGAPFDGTECQRILNHACKDGQDDPVYADGCMDAEP